jgi:hypothetical protein
MTDLPAKPENMLNSSSELLLLLSLKQLRQFRPHLAAPKRPRDDRFAGETKEHVELVVGAVIVGAVKAIALVLAALGHRQGLLLVALLLDEALHHLGRLKKIGRRKKIRRASDF